MSDFLHYVNQSSIRRQPLSAEMANALRFLSDMGITAEVFSGGQPAEGPGRTGSHRHDHGNAADVLFRKDGRQLSWENPGDLPLFEEIVRRGRQSGLTGFGAGPGYMQPGSMHIGLGKPGVWGAGGSGANAPEWLRAAFSGAAPAQNIPNFVPNGNPMNAARPIGTHNPANGLSLVPAGNDPTRMALDNTKLGASDLLEELQRSPTGQTVSPKAENGPPPGVFYYDSGNSDVLAPKIEPESTDFAPLVPGLYSNLQDDPDLAIGRPIDPTRPSINNPDGTFSTEKTITENVDGLWRNIPTIVDGQQRSPDEAIDLFRGGSNQSVGNFTSLDAALAAASARTGRIEGARNDYYRFADKPGEPLVPATPDVWSPPVIDRQLSRGDPTDDPAFPPQPRPNMSRMANVPQPMPKPAPESIVPGGQPMLSVEKKSDPLLEALLSGSSARGGGASAGQAPRPEMDLGDQPPILDGSVPDSVAAMAAPASPATDLSSLGAILAQILQETMAPQIAMRQRQAMGLV